MNAILGVKLDIHHISLDKVISPKTEGGQILPHLCSSHLMTVRHVIRLTQKQTLWSKCILQMYFMTCVGPKVFTSTTILGYVVEKLAL